MKPRAVWFLVSCMDCFMFSPLPPPLYLHSGPVHAGSQTVLLCSPHQSWIWTQPGLHRPPDAPWCAHSVRSAHTFLVLCLEGPVKEKKQMQYINYSFFFGLKQIYHHIWLIHMREILQLLPATLHQHDTLCPLLILKFNFSPHLFTLVKAGEIFVRCKSPESKLQRGINIF